MGRNRHLYGRVFQWRDLPREEVRPGVRRSSYATEEVMLVMNWLSPRMELGPHTHEDFDQLAYVLEGRANYYVGGVPHKMGPGSLLLVPAGKEHYIEPIGDEDDTVLNLDIFIPPRMDLLHLLSYLEGEESQP